MYCIVNKHSTATPTHRPRLIHYSLSVAVVADWKPAGAPPSSSVSRVLIIIMVIIVVIMGLTDLLCVVELWFRITRIEDSPRPLYNRYDWLMPSHNNNEEEKKKTHSTFYTFIICGQWRWILPTMHWQSSLLTLFSSADSWLAWSEWDIADRAGRR